MVDGYPTASLLGDMIGFIFQVHVLLHKVASLILEVLAVQGKDLGKQARIHLFVKFVY
jgi:hypothetical protein